jgi:PadR family transcriptional regulator, regulatory protein PadR
MPKRDSLQGSLDVMVLKILSRCPRIHGYAIMTAIKDMSDATSAPATGNLS